MGMQDLHFNLQVTAPDFDRLPARSQVLIFCEDAYLRHKRELMNIKSDKHRLLDVWRLSSHVYDMGKNIERYMSSLRQNFQAFDTALFATLGLTPDSESSNDLTSKLELENSLQETLQIYSEIKDGLGRLIDVYSVRLRSTLRKFNRCYIRCEEALSSTCRTTTSLREEAPHDEFVRYVKELALCKAEAYTCMVKTKNFLKTMLLIKQKLQ